MPNPPASPKAPEVPVYPYDAVVGRTEIMRKCLRCGELIPRSEGIPDACPSCRAPKTEFVLVEED